MTLTLSWPGTRCIRQYSVDSVIRCDADEFIKFDKLEE